ncbi:DUF1295 domain-containing protein [Breznakiella homolactica]|uniref:DUF1295 domain-containing protein n=1 Tax=Breznakiella homolactica TaxID=2798577 RepID=A0A7T7XQJ9_9SPIR|nr:DUF1295 domain-containing protein [Breznakiella homolactica]QQO10629.1 DUF1295 domain-containing protein [Breznakiella homolactica]
MKQFVLFLAAALCLSVIIMAAFAGGFAAFPQWLSAADPFVVVLLWAAGFSLCSFGTGIVTGDYSWVDRLWSTLPVAFVWFYAWRGGFSPVLLPAAGLITLWGIRLTWNFAKKGGYTGTEDYRWNILRGRITNPVLWQVFNLLFISCFQLGLFTLFTFPVYRMALASSGNLSLPFICAAALALGFLGFETLADHQQWIFHEAKHAAAGGAVPAGPFARDIPRGFLSHGLYSVSRHPNYFGELGFWWSVWLMAFSLYGAPVQSGIFGPLCLTALFIGSTVFTESLSSAKYPEYKKYQASVSPIIPWFPRKGGPDTEKPE